MANTKIIPEIKVCPRCGKSFEVGGRYRPHRKQIYCGRSCQAYARVKHAAARELSETEAAYLAGLIDGEGSIVAAKKRKSDGRITWRLQVVNTHLGVIEWVKTVTGTGGIITAKRRNIKHADLYIWEC